MATSNQKRPGLLKSLMPVLFIIVSLIITVIIFKGEATSGPAQFVLIMSGTVAAVFAHTHGVSWIELEKSILESMSDVMQAVLILLLIGSLIGVWILSGIVPAIIVWGLKILNPHVFLVASCIIAAMVSLATGSSWSTAGTIGVALIGIGQAMNINMGMTAGAIISGAYFGDKLSPFSETTNLASSMVGTELFTHIRHMLYTTIPAIVITLIIFTVIGLTQDVGNFSPERISIITDALNSKFDTSLYMLIPPILTFSIIIKRIPAIPAIITGIILGIVFAIIFQGPLITEIAGDADLSYGMASIKAIIKTASTGFNSSTGNSLVDELINKGGMSSMLNTVWLILSAMFFSGVMEGSGMIHRIADAILSRAKSTGSLIFSTIITNIFTNAVAADQYLSIVMTGRMYKDAYAQKGLHSKNLSRVLEDAGTLSSPLVPWNTCGSFMSSALGVSTFTYLPFAFLNLLTPIISAIYGFTGITIEKIKEDEDSYSENSSSEKE
jgi:NhaC family Na+:H+ antiporter